METTTHLEIVDDPKIVGDQPVLDLIIRCEDQELGHRLSLDAAKRLAESMLDMIAIHSK